MSSFVGFPSIFFRSVDWGYRLHLLHLCRRLRTTRHNVYTGYNIKQCDGEFPALETLGNLEYIFIAITFRFAQAMCDSVLFMGQIKQALSEQKTDVKLWLLYSNTWNLLTMCKKTRSGSLKDVIYKMCLQIIYI